MSSVRYMVDDVKEALDFYREYLGFTVEWDMGPNFASVRLDDLSMLAKG